MKFDLDISSTMHLKKNVLNKDNYLISDDLYKFIKYQRLSTLYLTDLQKKSIFL